MSQIKLKWDADGSIESFSVYRAEQSIDVNHLPTPIATGLPDKSYIDTNITNNTTYFYRVASHKHDSIKLSDEVSILAKPWAITANLSIQSINGTAKEGASIQVDVDTELTANFKASAIEILGTSAPDATITIQIED